MMAYGENYTPLAGPLKAGADLSGDQHRIVKKDANGEIVLCGADQMPTGVLKTKPTQGRTAIVAARQFDTCLVQTTGGSISKGTVLGMGADGRAVAITPANGKPMLGHSLDTATTNGELVRVTLNIGYTSA